MVNYVYLKLGAGYNGPTDTTTNIIPLKVTTVNISTSKTIPNVPVPFSGLLTGESVNVALDMGMSSKSIKLTGFILESEITKRFSDSEDAKVRTFTAIEIAQMIHSNDEGILGYIESFDCNIESTTIDISFNLSFAVANVFPNGNVATTIAEAIS